MPASTYFVLAIGLYLRAGILLIDLRQEDASDDEEDDEREYAIPLLAGNQRDHADEKRADDSGELTKHVEEAIELRGMIGGNEPRIVRTGESLYASLEEPYAAGKKIEIMVNYQPKLHYISEWWKQLYGESEGKDGKGIFPASCDFTTDLHSMGQWIQQGERTIYETVISVEQPNHQMLFPNDEENLDGLNFLAGKRVDEVNKMAELGTRLAHVDGGVPNIRVSVPVLNEYYIGQLIYFFEIACGISGNVLGVNPFNQPGVEAYKKNMFALLNKPGYEAESKAIQERLAKEK